jgi:hypothetical protein
MRFSAKTSVAFAALLAVYLSAVSGRAATAPADPCSLLTPAQVGSAMGGTYVAPQEKVAPRPYRNTVEGTDCTYRRGNGSGDLLFRVYFDPSAGDATTLFAKLKMFFGAGTPASGIGEEAYFDEKGALHARKSNVRFYLEAEAGKEAALTTLGGIVAGQL